MNSREELQASHARGEAEDMHEWRMRQIAEIKHGWKQINDSFADLKAREKFYKELDKEQF